MDVAVPRVEDVGDADLILLADALDLAQDMWKLGSRHDPVLGAIARRQPADGPKGLFAALPEQQPFRFAVRAAYFAGVVFTGNLGDTLGIGVQAGFQAVYFHDQDRAGIERKA